MSRWTAEQQRARDERRMAARVCTKCQAGLQEIDRRLCVECEAAQRETQRRYEATAGGRAVKASWAMKRRHARRAALLCTRCPEPPKPAAPGRECCPACDHLRKERRVASEDRKEAARAG